MLLRNESAFQAGVAANGRRKPAAVEEINDVIQQDPDNFPDSSALDEMPLYDCEDYIPDREYLQKVHDQSAEILNLYRDKLSYPTAAMLTDIVEGLESQVSFHLWIDEEMRRGVYLGRMGVVHRAWREIEDLCDRCAQHNCRKPSFNRP